MRSGKDWGFIGWTILIVLSFLCGLIYVVSHCGFMSNGQSYEIATDRYYCLVDSKKEALAAASESGGELESYADGVAVILIKRKDLIAYGSKPSSIETSKAVLKKEVTYKPTAIDSPANNPCYEDQWYLRYIKVKKAYRNGITGKGAVVAVIDTGCDVSHPDLKRNIKGKYNAVDPEHPEYIWDVDGHGTFVAGIIASVDNGIGTVGVAPDASLYIIKADSRNGLFYLSNVIRGVNKAVEENVDVINMSFGTYITNDDLYEAISNATEHGILCVAAAGNGHSSLPYYPAAYDNVIGVAGFQENGELADFSNYGSSADIAAPGSNIWSTHRGDGYYGDYGTSMACPIVSGVAALIYGSNENFRLCDTRSSRDQVYNMIMSGRDMKTYSSIYGQVIGSVNVQNIFNSVGVSVPKIPTIKVNKESGTNQVVVSISGSKNSEIWYTINGKFPYVGIGEKYTGKIRLDKAGNYKIKAVAVTGRTYSDLVNKAVKVEKNVYSQELVKSMSIHFKNIKSTKVQIGKQKQLYVSFENNPKKKVDLRKIKWSSSNVKLATVSKDGKVMITKNKNKAGKKVTITGKFGSVKRKFTFTLI